LPLPAAFGRLGIFGPARAGAAPYHGR